MKGMLITFEGGEGSGKSTQAERLVKHLQDTGRTVVAAREPGGTSVGESVRRILQHGTAESRLFDETELLLFAASRSQLARQVIVPALSSGEFVVCDRFIDSTVAYQAFARGLNSEDVSKINEFACDGVIPDLTFLLDLDVKRGFERIQQRNMRSSTEIDRIEKEDMAFHEKVREGYLKLAKSEPGRIHTICSERGPDVIEAEIWQIVEKKAFAEDR